MPMPLVARTAFALALLAASDAGANVVICVVDWGEPVPQRDYVIEPTSWMALGGAAPTAISGSLRLRQWRLCGGEPGERRAAIESLELTNGSETLAHPPVPVIAGPRRITAEAGYLYRDSYYVRGESQFGTWWLPRTHDGAFALLDQWVEPIDEEEAWLHQVWMKSDPDGESLIDWTRPDGLPAHLDLALRIESNVLHCHHPEVGSYGCTLHASSGTIGSLRLVANLPEPTAATSSLAAIAALFVLRYRADSRTRSHR